MYSITSTCTCIHSFRVTVHKSVGFLSQVKHLFYQHCFQDQIYRHSLSTACAMPTAKLHVCGLTGVTTVSCTASERTLGNHTNCVLLPPLGRRARDWLQWSSCVSSRAHVHVSGIGTGLPITDVFEEGEIKHVPRTLVLSSMYMYMYKLFYTSQILGRGNKPQGLCSPHSKWTL